MTSDVGVKEVSEVEVGADVGVEKTSSVNYIPLDSRKCPICRTLREKAEKIKQLTEKLGLSESKAPRYCPFHYKIINILKLSKDSKSERIFKIVSNEKSINITFGYQNNSKKATILIIIPKAKNGKISVMANGRLYRNVHPEILGLLNSTELDLVAQYISESKEDAN